MDSLTIATLIADLTRSIEHTKATLEEQKRVRRRLKCACDDAARREAAMHRGVAPALPERPDSDAPVSAVASAPALAPFFPQLQNRPSRVSGGAGEAA